MKMKGKEKKKKKEEEEGKEEEKEEKKEKETKEKKKKKKKELHHVNKFPEVFNKSNVFLSAQQYCYCIIILYPNIIIIIINDLLVRHV